MCTLALVSRVWPDTPLLIAANRDELLGRPAAPPGPLAVLPRRAFGPRDLQAGGTWLGLNDAGVFAGLTSRMGARHGGPRRSRGLLLLDALRADSASRAAEAARRACRPHLPSAS